MTDTPQPSRRAFGYPLPAEALAYFTHPDPSCLFADPFALDEDTIAAANGFAAIRVQSYIDPDVLAEATQEARDRVARLPWHRFDELTDKDRWKSLDSIGGMLWKYGPKPIWERTRTRHHIRTAPTVTVGKGAVALWPLIQLAARLPRAEVWADNSPNRPVFVRFNGGQLILAHSDRFAAPRFTIFKPRTHFDGKVDW